MFLRFIAGVWLIVGLGLDLVASADTAAVKIFSAEYLLPVADNAQKPFATFPVDAYTVETHTDGATTLSFILPDDLTAGRSQKLTFNEVQKTTSERLLKGEFGTMTCSIPWLGSECKIVLDSKIVPNYLKIVDFILDKYDAGDGLMERLALLKQFSTEPVGFVKVLGLAPTRPVE